MPVLRAEVRGIPAADDLESLQCVHIGVQGTGSHRAIQGDSQAGRIPGNPLLTIVLAVRGGTGRAASPITLFQLAFGAVIKR